MNPQIPDAAGLTPDQRAQAIIDNELKPWAAAQTASNKLGFDNAVAASKETGNPPPASYIVWGVNEPLVFDIEAGRGGDPSKLFVQTVIAVPPPPIVVVPGLKIDTDPSVTSMHGLFEASSGDGPAVVLGTKHAQDGHVYQKIGPVGFSMFSQYPDHGVYLWQQVG